MKAVKNSYQSTNNNFISPSDNYGLRQFIQKGAIRRLFGKQMDKETKLRIHNITAKAALKFGREAWVLKKREE